MLSKTNNFILASINAVVVTVVVVVVGVVDTFALKRD